MDAYCPYPWIGASDQYEEKLYDILSYSIPKRNLEIIKRYGKLLDINQIFDGNAYRLVDLLDKFDLSNKTDKEIVDFFKKDATS